MFQFPFLRRGTIKVGTILTGVGRRKSYVGSKKIYDAAKKRGFVERKRKRDFRGVLQERRKVESA